MLKELNIAKSMSRRGNCWDDAPQESFFGHMKDELHLKECDSYENVCKELDNYFDYYNMRFNGYIWIIDIQKKEK